MVTDIMDGISVKLNQIFGDGYEIYGDKDVKQGLTEPCFFIAVLNPSRQKLVGQRYAATNQFDVHYFPKESDNNTEMQKIAERLFDEMEQITLIEGDVLHGTKMRYEIINGVLHFFVNYNMILRREGNKEVDMTSAEINTRKGE